MLDSHEEIEGRIKRLIRRAEKVIDDELKAEITRYICVLISSLFELQCKDVASKFAKLRSQPDVLKFVESHLKTFRNPSPQKIRELFSRFNHQDAKDWHDGLEDEERDALGSIVSNRNQIAHGKDVVLTLRDLNDYRKRASNAIVELDRKFG